MLHSALPVKEVFMNKKLFWGLIFGIGIFSTLAATRSMWMDVDDLKFLRTYIPKIHVLPKEQSLAYEQACASCHMLYAPSMLPARSWKKMMSGLDDHFGDNAELEKNVEAEVSAYLQRNAADQVENIYAQPLLNLLPEGSTPLRISDTTYFKFLHDVVKPDMVSGNLDVLSIARCDTCHHEALDGRFNKFAVRIPNYTLQGKWIKTSLARFSQ